MLASAMVARTSGATSVAGAYRTAAGTEVVALSLLTNGNYLARWDLDIFPNYGRAAGTWTLDGDTVHLTPKKEEGKLKGHLTAMLVRKRDGHDALLRIEDAKHAENPFFYFYRKESANKSPDPTPASVTPAAIAPGAPPSGVGHH